MKYLIIIIISVFISSCLTIQGRFVDSKNNIVGKKYVYATTPTQFHNSNETYGKMTVGLGMVYASETKNEATYHWDLFSSTDYGSCKTYYVVDKNTNIVLRWGYESGVNPDSCFLIPKFNPYLIWQTYHF